MAREQAQLLEDASQVDESHPQPFDPVDRLDDAQVGVFWRAVVAAIRPLAEREVTLTCTAPLFAQFAIVALDLAPWRLARKKARLPHHGALELLDVTDDMEKGLLEVDNLRPQPEGACQPRCSQRVEDCGCHLRIAHRLQVSLHEIQASNREVRAERRANIEHTRRLCMAATGVDTPHVALECAGGRGACVGGRI